MNVFELTIIYLALGAPFGVYHVTTHPAETAVLSTANVTLNIVLWPVYILSFVYAHFRHANPAVESTETLRKQLESRASEHLGAVEMREFRDTLARYIGLSEAAEMPIGTSAIDGLAATGVIKSLPSTSSVARRQNRERILRHRADAREDLLSAARNIPDIADIVHKLAASVRDDAELELQPNITSNDQKTSQNSGPVSLAA